MCQEEIVFCLQTYLKRSLDTGIVKAYVFNYN